jgi:hypothetical protein
LLYKDKSAPFFYKRIVVILDEAEKDKKKRILLAVELLLCESKEINLNKYDTKR